MKHLKRIAHWLDIRLRIVVSIIAPEAPGTYLITNLAVAFGLTCVVRANPSQAKEKEPGPFVQVAELDGHISFEASPFSDDGSRIVARVADGDDHSIQVWDLTTFKPLTKPLRHQGFIWRQLGADGKEVFSAGYYEINFWDIQTSLVRSTIHLKDDLFFALLGPDGSTFITEHDDDVTSFHLWKKGDARPMAELRHSRAVTFAAFDKSGRRIITREWKVGAEFHVWDATTGLEICKPIVSDFPFEGDESDPVAAFDKSGKRVVIARESGFALVDVETGKILSTGQLKGRLHTESVRLSDDGTTVAIVTESNLVKAENGPIEIFDAASGKLLRSIADGSLGCAFCPNGRWLLCSKLQPQPAELWDLSTGLKVQTFFEMSGTIAFSPDGTTLAITRDDKTTIWRMREKENGKSEK